MRTLKELIDAHGIALTAVYTHSVDGMERELDYDVYDCFFTIEAEPSLYGGISNIRTLLVRAFGQSPAAIRFHLRPRKSWSGRSPTLRESTPTTTGVNGHRSTPGART